MKSDRVPVLIDAATYQRLKQLSDNSGVPVSKLARRAISEWLESPAAKRIADALKK